LLVAHDEPVITNVKASAIKPIFNNLVFMGLPPWVKAFAALDASGFEMVYIVK